MYRTLCLDLSKSQADAWLLSSEQGSCTHEKICSFDFSLSATAPSELASESSTEVIPEPSTLPGALLDTVAPLRSRIDKIVVITDGQGILSRGVKLPFADPKRSSQLLLPEVADQVPFPLEDFVVSPSTPTKVNDEYLFPILVIQNSKMSRLLSLLKASQLDPNEIILPSGLLIPRADEEPYAAIVESGTSLYVRLMTPVASLQRILNYDLTQRRMALTVQELKQTLLFFERETASSIHKLIVYGQPELHDTLKTSFPEQFEQEYVTTSLIELMTEAVKKDHAPENLRIGPFSYQVKLGGLLRSVASTLPYAALGLAIALAGVFGFKASQSNAIHQLYNTSAHAVHEIAPDVSFESDPQALVQLQTKNRELEKQLQDLGSPSKFSSLDVLKNISNDFPTGGNIAVSSLRIRGDEVILEGTAPDYAAVEKIERILKNKRTTLCKVTKDAGSGQSRGNQGRGFTFTIKLCD